MTKDTIDRTIDVFVEKYGIEKNLIVLVEELAELQQAVCKYLRHSENAVIRKNKQELIDDIRVEVADVLYCMHYLCSVTDNSWGDYMEMTADKAIENQGRFDRNGQNTANPD